MAKSNPIAAKMDSTADILNKMFDFIVENFRKMPKWIQVPVYLVMVACFVLGTLKIFFPEWVTRPEVIEISGEITGGGGSSLPDSLWTVELHGQNLYVTKTAAGDDFIYEWILKVPREGINDVQRFSVSKYSSDAKKVQSLIKNVRFDRSLLLAMSKTSKDGKVHLMMNDTFTSIEVDTNAHKFADIVHERTAVSSWELMPRAYAQSMSRQTRITKANVKGVLQKYIRTSNPEVQEQLAAQLVSGGVPIMVEVAESLKSAVRTRRSANTANYASLLVEFDSLGLLTSGGRYSAIFDSAFYARGVELLHSGDEFESRNMAAFLRAMQDSRSLSPLFNEFAHVRDETSKKLCLYVIDGFTSNTSNQVKKKIITWLDSSRKNEKSASLRSAIDQSYQNFTNPRSLNRAK